VPTDGAKYHKVTIPATCAAYSEAFYIPTHLDVLSKPAVTYTAEWDLEPFQVINHEKELTGLQSQLGELVQSNDQKVSSLLRAMDEIAEKTSVIMTRHVNHHSAMYIIIGCISFMVLIFCMVRYIVLWKRAKRQSAQEDNGV
jgi:hypothetical protein